MDKSMILRHLRNARDHIEKGERTLRRQRAVIAELVRDGHDATRANALLTEFEEIQGLHLADRDRLLRELKQASSE